MRLVRKLSLLGAALTALAVATPEAAAQTALNSGFQLNRYEPTAAGEWSFAVDHPWYSSTRYFAAGITLNYAHAPLVLGLQSGSQFQEQRALVSHQLITHIDLAGSFLDRILVTASLPVVWVSKGDQLDYPITVGDPRIGLMGRLYGQPYESVFSASLGLTVWVPLRGFTDSIPEVASEQQARVAPKLILGGVWKKLLWSATAAFMWRQDAQLAALPAGSPAAIAGKAGSELQFGLAGSYFDQVRHFSVGPELLIATTATGDSKFSRYGTSFEALLGGQYHLMNMLQLGLAAGLGFVRQPGTPDFRLLARIAYAPVRKTDRDRDGDGIADRDDACPDEPGIRTGDRRTHGCPPPQDRDHDGIKDDADICPDTHKGPTPDPARLGCPAPALPEPDRDNDGVLDRDDVCPDVPRGQQPDPNRLGCPAQDSDKDGIIDANDQCIFDPMGLNPDPDKLGCPLPDRDRDHVPDKTDACPDKAGAPHPDPKKNGCPSLVEIKNGQLVIMKPVFFATDKDIILPQSNAVLEAVANALRAVPTIKKLAIEGHTDNQGKFAYNMDLSDRRAKSVMRDLIKRGIDAGRLEARGYGPTRPIKTNNTVEGRAANRRVEFHIVDGGGTAVQAN